MASKHIKDKLSLVPNKPGCYQMRNIDNTIIYVGKAKKLKNRLSSYFRGVHYGKTAKLVSEIVDFEYIVVGSEKEAFILEQNLIKKYEPKYNILMRDDKSYPYIELTRERVPRLTIVHNLNKKKNKERLFGPYPNVTAARATVNILNRLYPLRKCNVYPKKPCLYYHLHECLGYCVYDIEDSVIKKMEEEIIEFLRGNTDNVINKLTVMMNNASDHMNYEKAKEYKDLLDYINITSSKQEVEINDTLSRDVFGFYTEKYYLSVVCFFIRGGKIVERHKKIIPLIEDVKEDLTNFIANFYSADVLVPNEILVPSEADSELLGSILNAKVLVPQKGVKKDILNMANKNAEIILHEDFEMIEKDVKRTEEANNDLMNLLGMNKLDRIELFDNSNLFGTFNVSGMVVFKNGRPSKNDYRKYKITIDKNDDYGTMKEVIYRRYFRVLSDSLERPDLIIVDGGLGQIHVAREIINELNINIPVIGLKKDNHHNTEALLAFDPIKEIPIPKNSDLFHYLERMQDEVHNYTISYHRQLRNKGAFASYLDEIPGIGESRKKALLTKFRSLKNMKEASIEELKEILPEKEATILKTFLENYER